MNKLDKRKIMGTIIGVIIWSFCVIFFTYAYYNWKSDSTAFSFEIQEQGEPIICENGPDINVSNVGPVLDYNDGVAATFKVQNSSTRPSNFPLSLEIISISDSLLVESFKYILLKGDYDGTNFTETGIEGNFSSFQVGTNTISANVSVDANSSNTFKFIVYIDGSMYNSPDMMSASMSSDLMIGNCDATYLNSVEPGSYVTYTGTSGCPDGHCDGTNANYVSDTNKGYCGLSGYKVNGWRVGYIKDDSAYLISAGAPECMCTNSNGTSSNSSCGNYETTTGIPIHLYNLDSKSRTYCNPTYAYGGVCNSNSAWAMDETDFQMITGNTLSSCDSSSSELCGLGNDLIDNGGNYWYATPNSSWYAKVFIWLTSNGGPGSGFHYVYRNSSDNLYGVRPVLRLASSVQVIGGTGTYEDPYQIANLTPEIPNLSEVAPGSYVAYTGTNGCPDGHCDGTNANYVSDTNMGYCANESYKFSVNGWRVGYTKDDSAYLVSAGAPECMCTNTDGTISNSSCSSNETTEGVPQHLSNLYSKAKTYCNPTYAYRGVCNRNSVWSMDATDFQAITGNELSGSSCYQSSNNPACGFGNDLIDNGGSYWYATPYRYNSNSAPGAFGWATYNHYVGYSSSNFVSGVRPVLRLASSVQVIGGTGTYKNPYIIENQNPDKGKLSDVDPGSYVAYTGTNGCPSGHCDGTNANYESDDNMGYCYNSYAKFGVNGWRVGYVQDGSAYLVSAGAPECMCTNSNGTLSNSSCSDSETTIGVPQHLANLDSRAKTYCNPDYAYRGLCNNDSARAMNATDFQIITGSILSSSSCYKVFYNTECGYKNNLIDNGGFYWYATPYNSSSTDSFYWKPISVLGPGDGLGVDTDGTTTVLGVRPILRLASDIQVVAGSGTYANPYQIENPSN